MYDTCIICTTSHHTKSISILADIVRPPYHYRTRVIRTGWQLTKCTRAREHVITTTFYGVPLIYILATRHQRPSHGGNSPSGVTRASAAKQKVGSRSLWFNLIYITMPLSSRSIDRNVFDEMRTRWMWNATFSLTLTTTIICAASLSLTLQADGDVYFSAARILSCAIRRSVPKYWTP